MLLASLHLPIPCLFSTLIAHAQRLEVEIKTMRSKVKQLEDALAIVEASGNRAETDIFGPSPSPIPGASEDIEVTESISSFSVDSDGVGKYHGGFAGSEVHCLMCYLLTSH